MLEDRIEKSATIIICGKRNVGKTTFIRDFFGIQYLPTDFDENTFGTLTIKNNDNNTMTIIKYDNTGQQITEKHKTSSNDSELEEKIKKKMKECRENKNYEYMAITIERKFDCKYGPLCIIDSQGTDDSATREKYKKQLQIEYDKADNCIYIINGQRMLEPGALNGDNTEVFNDLLNAHHHNKNIQIMITKYDDVVNMSNYKNKPFPTFEDKKQERLNIMIKKFEHFINQKNDKFKDKYDSLQDIIRKSMFFIYDEGNRHPHYESIIKEIDEYFKKIHGEYNKNVYYHHLIEKQMKFVIIFVNMLLTPIVEHNIIPEEVKTLINKFAETMHDDKYGKAVLYRILTFNDNVFTDLWKDLRQYYDIVKAMAQPKNNHSNSNIANKCDDNDMRHMKEYVFGKDIELKPYKIESYADDVVREFMKCMKSDEKYCHDELRQKTINDIRRDYKNLRNKELKYCIEMGEVKIEIISKFTESTPLFLDDGLDIRIDNMTFYSHKLHYPYYPNSHKSNEYKNVYEINISQPYGKKEKIFTGLHDGKKFSGEFTAHIKDSEPIRHTGEIKMDFLKINRNSSGGILDMIKSQITNLEFEKKLNDSIQIISRFRSDYIKSVYNQNYI